MSTLSDGSRKVFKRAVKRVRRLDMPETRASLFWALEQEASGEKMPKKRQAARAATPAPPGVDPGSHAMHERITERMKLLDVSYQTALEQVMADDAGHRVVDAGRNVKHGPLMPIDSNSPKGA
jgi:hypothetical protein